MIPVLIVTSDGETIWTALEEPRNAFGTISPRNWEPRDGLRALKSRIANDNPVQVSNERPVASTWDSLECILNWDHIIGMTAFPAVP